LTSLDCCDGSDEGRGVCPNDCKAINVEIEKEKIESEQMLKEALQIKSKLREIGKEDLKFMTARRETLTKLLTNERDMLKQSDAIANLKAKSSTNVYDTRELQERVVELERILLEEKDSDQNQNQNQNQNQKFSEYCEKYGISQDISSEEEEFLYGDDKAFSTPQVKDSESKSGSKKKELFGLDSFRMSIKAMAKAFNKIRVTTTKTITKYLASQPTLVSDDNDEANNNLMASLKRRIEEYEGEERDLFKKLSLEYPDDSYRALYGQCFSSLVGEYTYEHCLFRNITQKDSVGRRTTLGVWKGWVDGQMEYSGGTVCWHGPSREAKVRVECGRENLIVNVSERAMCSYLVRFTTPAACKERVQEDSANTSPIDTNPADMNPADTDPADTDPADTDPTDMDPIDMDPYRLDEL
jgi:protein kinase C substrate 80K-H